jgi:hypothetical protein
MTPQGGKRNEEKQPSQENTIREFNLLLLPDILGQQKC